MNTSTTTRHAWLGMAVPSIAVCLLLSDQAFATGIPCLHNSGSANIQTPVSWFFAVIFFVMAASHFRAARKEKTPVNKTKILLHLLAALALASMPFVFRELMLANSLRWMPGLVVCSAGGWLSYRLTQSARFPAVVSAILAIGFTAVLSWPFVYYEYTIAQRPGCKNMPSPHYNNLPPLGENNP